MNISINSKIAPEATIRCVALVSFGAASPCMAEIAAKLATDAEAGYVGAAAVSRMCASLIVTTSYVGVVVKTPGMPNLTKSLQVTVPSALVSETGV